LIAESVDPEREEEEIRGTRAAENGEGTSLIYERPSIHNHSAFIVTIPTTGNEQQTT
jgi:hypothetical protein